MPIPRLSSDFGISHDFDSLDDMLQQEFDLTQLLLIKSEYEVLKKLDHPLITELQELYLDCDNIHFVTPQNTGGELYELIAGAVD